MILMLLLVSEIKNPKKHFSFLADTQMLLHILQGVKASAKRGLKHVFLSH
jgi:hypothetical protein